MKPGSIAAVYISQIRGYRGRQEPYLLALRTKRKPREVVLGRGECAPRDELNRRITKEEVSELVERALERGLLAPGDRVVPPSMKDGSLWFWTYVWRPDEHVISLVRDALAGR